MFCRPAAGPQELVERRGESKQGREQGDAGEEQGERGARAEGESGEGLATLKAGPCERALRRAPERPALLRWRESQAPGRLPPAMRPESVRRVRRDQMGAEPYRV